MGAPLAGLNAIAQLTAIGADPIWSIIVLMIGALIIDRRCVDGFDEQ